MLITVEVDMDNPYKLERTFIRRHGNKDKENWLITYTSTRFDGNRRITAIQEEVFWEWLKRE